MVSVGLNIRKPMLNKRVRQWVLAVATIGMFSSCTVSKIYPKEYYRQNKTTMQEMESLYGAITKKNLLAVAFNDLSFNELSVELKTDTVRYIYDFVYEEPRMYDSVAKYGYDSSLFRQLVGNMRRIGCSWINTMDYYVDGRKRLLLFMSAPVKQISLVPAFQKRKYYLFNFYQQPQYYDAAGRLLDKRKLRRLRKINSEVFYRITDKVCYTVSGEFR
jgi:hypothetical protein